MLEQTQHFGDGFGLPRFIESTFEEFLRCGVLSHGFVRVVCEDCRDEMLLAFSCKRRGVCPSCEGRRMADTAAYLVDEVLPEVAYRQGTLSMPRKIRFLLVRRPKLVSPVLSIFLRAVFRHQRQGARKLELGQKVHTGAVTFVQRFAGA